ncbi:hypothetical protein H257_04288 [Aphanomyces astaci]|uniref:Uncharacterized protein n=1 Tax=Aphanomyces astaci TaxID=112090 RepID=W4GV56_APHAT|nr:hypothetical protein H257_04288 [Aphanomyces astaci]ETV83590.1 hypothetical protein H257_04288 [Aphanomyces astaci]KAF0750489.1 hypothetical protein AaE_006694 [Aphanomyces astaci]RHY14004.1 hypothetical protein DYB25_001411 [Aphanomyces astaci]RHY22409.1 hypothetical protein DYB36_011175 [Aphanomyces astaci]RHY48948.1 hypothetical protein DYB38_013687 [Aphanomyces astaci]|eukprot:XP_009827020.1 hypothetical protein H257_04288 [Aphanomyces astaci]
MSTYAVQGILYFLAHPSLWLTLLCPTIMTILVALCSVIGLFAIALYPTAVLYKKAGLPAGWAWVLAVVTVLAEIFLTTLIYSLTCSGCFVDKIFEKVLTMRGHGRVIEEAEVKARCCRQCKACCNVSIWLRLVVLVVTLPLNLIPIVGTMAYVWLNASLKGWEAHLYYFEMKGYRYDEQKAIFTKRRLQYTSFGMQCMYLEMIPFLGFFFLLTNAIGAALFAADMEEELLNGDSTANPDNAGLSEEKEMFI